MPKNFNSKKLDSLKKVDALFKAMYLFPKNSKNYAPLEKNEIKEIIVLGFFLIGDTVIYLPALRTLKRNFPNAKITIVCEKAVSLILNNQEAVDEYITVKCPWMAPVDYSAKAVFKFFSSIRTINRKKYDLSIDFRGDWRNIFFMNLINAKRKFGYNATGGDYMLTDVIVPEDNIDHFIEESFYMLRQIGCEYDEKDKLPVLNLTTDDRRFIETFQIDNELEDKFIIGVHPGTTQDVKRWDEDKYSNLIIHLANDYQNAVFVIYEGPDERQYVNKIEITLQANGITNYLVVKRSLHDYLLLISLCRLMICNDSGAAHIAAAYGIPTLAIFGNVDPKFVIPYGAKFNTIISHQLECKPCNQSYCKFGTNACIAGINEPEVYDEAIKIINQIMAGDVMAMSN